MNFSQHLSQHLIDLGLTVDQILAQLPEHLTLSLDDGVLCLYDRHNPQSKLNVDFINGPLAYRSHQHLGGENLIKACQIKGNKQLRVLDATCGLGTDSYLLQQAGFQVFATEKNIITYALLLDGLQRYQQHSKQTGFQLLLGDATVHLNNLDVDVIYLDPMFPRKIKSAKNKKTMQLFQSLHHGQIDDALQMLQLALKANCQRVVIKRPSKAPLLTSYKPSFQLLGKTCRFDAYQR